jgi:hypothetical protein
VKCFVLGHDIWIWALRDSISTAPESHMRIHTYSTNAVPNFEHLDVMPYVYFGKSRTPDLKVVNVGAWVTSKCFHNKRGYLNLIL